MSRKYLSPTEELRPYTGPGPWYIPDADLRHGKIYDLVRAEELLPDGSWRAVWFMPAPDVTPAEFRQAALKWRPRNA